MLPKNQNPCVFLMKTVIRITTYFLVLFALLVCTFETFFFWMYETTDSWFYWGFANFMRTGVYEAPHPYYYHTPSTMEPPLYSVLLFFSQFFQRGDIVIHLVQVASLIASSVLLYYVVRTYVGQRIATLVGLVFFILPINILYTSNLLAENIALFFIALYIFFIHTYFYRKDSRALIYLLPLSSLMTLQRYNFIAFFIFSFVLFFLTKRKTSAVYIAAIISLCIVGGWSLINFRLTGVFNISNSTGKNTYNRIVWISQLLPHADNKKLIELKKILPENMDLRQPWWMLEPYLLSHFNYSETKGSELLKEVSLEALKSNIPAYLESIPGAILMAHSRRLPIHDGLYTTGRYMGSNCRSLGQIFFCKPLISLPVASVVWDRIVAMTEGYYQTVIPEIINYGIFFPFIIISFFQKDRFIRICGVLYILSASFPLLLSEPGTRYNYPLFPMKIIILVTCGMYLFKKISRKFVSGKNKKDYNETR